VVSASHHVRQDITNSPTLGCDIRRTAFLCQPTKATQESLQRLHTQETIGFLTSQIKCFTSSVPNDCDPCVIPPVAYSRCTCRLHYTVPMIMIILVDRNGFNLIFTECIFNHDMHIFFISLYFVNKNSNNLKYLTFTMLSFPIGFITTKCKILCRTIRKSIH